jgi:hypothetical protein
MRTFLSSYQGDILMEFRQSRQFYVANKTICTQQCSPFLGLVWLERTKLRGSVVDCASRLALCGAAGGCMRLILQCGAIPE